MKVTILGTGTSTGVPVPGCRCDVCISGKKNNSRFRASCLIEVTKPGQSCSLLIDTTPDLRSQALAFDVRHIDAVAYTHIHADHIFGLDDLRSFNFASGKTIDIYADADTAEELKRIFRYAFVPDARHLGGSPPALQLHVVRSFVPFLVHGVGVIPIHLRHGNLDVLGFRVGDFAYLTDCSEIPPSSVGLLHNLKVLVLDGLRYRPHPTHLTHEQAVALIETLRPEKTYLTHISHEVDHDEANEKLRHGTSMAVELAYDGLEIELL